MAHAAQREVGRRTAAVFCHNGEPETPAFSVKVTEGNSATVFTDMKVRFFQIYNRLPYAFIFKAGATSCKRPRVGFALECVRLEGWGQAYSAAAVRLN